jgi:hypothetical protein
LGETALSAGVLTLQGTNDTAPKLEIINNGDLTISNTVICNTANLTIQNNGNLTLQDVGFTLNSNATLVISNDGTCTMTEASIQVYGGYVYLTSTASLSMQNFYLKDQFDGTSIANYGNANMSECTFVANGAEGKIEIFNGGNLQLNHCVFDVNYGGTLNINTLTGTLTATECNMDISGASQGKKSSSSILGDNATWDSCSLVNNGGTINYLNTGEVNLTNFTVDNWGVDASTILSSSGPMVFENSHFSGSGSTSITNWDSITFIDSNLTSSDSLTLMNNAELTAENWLLKTTSNTASILIYNDNNGNITFNVSFIENVSSEALEAVSSDGQEFVESSGGTITVTNKGTITEKAEPASTPEPTATPTPTNTPEPTSTPTPTNTPQPTATPTPTESPNVSSTPEPSGGLGENENPDANFIYGIAIVIAVIVISLLLLGARKKLFKTIKS